MFLRNWSRIPKLSDKGGENEPSHVASEAVDVSSPERPSPRYLCQEDNPMVLEFESGGSLPEGRFKH